MVYIRVLAIGALFLIFSTLAFSQSHQSLRKGDSFYDKKEYSDAEKAYRDATARDAQKPSGAYNTGNALYRQGNYDDAAQHFQTVAKHPNATPGMQADALYNLGNSLLKQNKYKESVQAFENSLRIRPGDPQAKVNLQFAKKKLKEQEQQQQQQQQQQNKDQSQNQQQNQQNKDKNQQQSQTDPSTAQQQQEEKQEEQRTSRAEAQRLLESTIGPEDRKTAKKYKQQQSASQKTGEKDW
jgi:tetratricopeptide (TPR) repeat protein